MKSLTINFKALVLAVVFLVTVILLGYDCESMSVFFVTKVAGMLTAAAGVVLGMNWAQAGKFGEVAE